MIVTKPLAARMKLKQGDTATIVRKADNHKFSLRIDSIADTYAGNFIFMPLAEYNIKFEMPEGSYTSAFSNALLDLPGNREYNVVSLDEKVAGIREAIAPTQSMVGFIVVMSSYESAKFLCRKKINAVSLIAAIKSGME